MSEQPLPYLRSCPVCGDGQLQLHRCGRCDEVVAICDECELIWRDAAEASRSAEPKSDAAFPACPACGAQRVKWFRLDRDEIREAGLEVYLADGDDFPPENRGSNRTIRISGSGP